MKKYSVQYFLRVLLLISFLSAITGNAIGAESENLKTATFAGGCFWCMEHAFDEVDGVVSTISGYIGGHKDHPTYREVSSGTTGHTEAVQVVYDSSKVRYGMLLEVFWTNIDPTVKDRQFCDRGNQYRTTIFYHTKEQKKLAVASKRSLERDRPFEGPVVTPILQASQFFPAEEHHQDYHIKNPLQYKFYRFSCGRDQRLKELWGKRTSFGGLRHE
ncbi:MAG TPA: peptide-methionine (S)-S-oxide reductase MsrA [Nitrospira sp.]|nr:peptide-methionine (S)-S-oxide reductase MsrA [Candidatus Manganitrophaceae bacterium]